jgi:hypothetical protein
MATCIDVAGSRPIIPVLDFLPHKSSAAAEAQTPGQGLPKKNRGSLSSHLNSQLASSITILFDDAIYYSEAFYENLQSPADFSNPATKRKASVSNSRSPSYLLQASLASLPPLQAKSQRHRRPIGERALSRTRRPLPR